MKVLIVNNVDLSIASKYDADAPSQSNYGGPWGSSMFTSHVICPEELDSDCVKAEMQDDEIIIVADEAKVAIKLQSQRNLKLEQIRRLRDEKLIKVDRLVNIAVLDAWTTTEKNELKTYRQALLDITEPYKADMSLLDNDIEWPIEPSAE